MTFGVKNAPGNFQIVIDVILATVKWQYALVYLEDVIILSDNVQKHLKHVYVVLRRFSNAGVTLKLKKCFLFTDTVDYLRHLIIPVK